jgi:hypothetical protein
MHNSLFMNTYKKVWLWHSDVNRLYYLTLWVVSDISWEDKQWCSLVLAVAIIQNIRYPVTFLLFSTKWSPERPTHAINLMKFSKFYSHAYISS